MARYDRAAQREKSKRLSAMHASSNIEKDYSRQKQWKGHNLSDQCKQWHYHQMHCQSVLTVNEMDSLAKAETEVKELKQMSQIGREKCCCAC